MVVTVRASAGTRNVAVGNTPDMEVESVAGRSDTGVGSGVAAFPPLLPPVDTLPFARRTERGEPEFEVSP